MKMPSNVPHKTVYILPNLFTTGNILLGFLAILSVMQENYALSSLLIIMGAFCDGLDGKVARLTKTTSDFGIQYDSLADGIAFGVAPALLVYKYALFLFGNLGIAVSFLYLTCGILRLARFNVTTATLSKRFFIGLPIPFGAGSICSAIFFIEYLKQIYNVHIAPECLLVFTTFLAWLMISHIRYFSFKEFGTLQERPFQLFLLTILALAVLTIQARLLLFIYALIYIASGMLYTYLYLPTKAKKIASKG